MKQSEMVALLDAFEETTFDAGADVITHFISNNLADAAADASPGARTDSRPDRTTLEDANHTTLTTTLINTF